jgi:restriction endonuclease S subunit
MVTDKSTLERELTPLDEQKKIGELFDTISDLITLHQREPRKLQNMKKALPEKTVWRFTRSAGCRTER